MAEAGKGDTPRPIVDRAKFESNWDAIFGKKKCPLGECKDKTQCWEPCGDLGKSDEHTIPLLGVI